MRAARSHSRFLSGVMASVILFLCIVLGNGCWSQRFGTYPELGLNELRVGVSPDFPPLIFEENGRIQGVDADFAVLLAKELGIRMKFVRVPWLDLIPALNDGKIDIIMSATSVTPERSQRILFVQPYFTISQMALIRTRDISRFPDVAAIVAANARVGVVSETTGDQYVRENLPRARRIPFSSFDLAVEDLLKGRIDVVISDASTISHVTDPKLVGMYEPLTEEHLAWAVKNGNEEFRKILDGIVEKWKNDGTLQRVRDRWMSGLIRTRVY
jgi:ABC-type amino acid transport substrate-binding protein